MLPPDAGLCTVKVFVLQMPGKIRCAVFFHICHSQIDRFVGAVGLGRGGKKHHCFCNGNPRFRQSQLEGAVHTGLCDDNCLGISQPDIFGCNDEKPPA